MEMQQQENYSTNEMNIDDGQAQVVSFRKIEELEQFGVARPDISKLKAGGYHTIESVSYFILFHFSLYIFIFIYI